MDSVFYNVDPRFTTGLLVQVDVDGGDLKAGTDYFIRKLGGGSYSFYKSVKGAATDDASERVDLTGDVTAGVFGSREKIYRIRGLANDTINQKYWEILTPLGIDQATDLKNLILKTDAPVSLNYVQDLDHDGMPADVEYFLRSSDSPMTAGAVVPGTTDFKTEMSVSYGTDPGFSPDPARPELATGTLVRVTDTGGGLTAGENYTIRYLHNYAYSFYDKDGVRVNLTDKITAGIFATAKPSFTDHTNQSVTFNPGFATATAVQVTASGGGLTAGTDYYIRNLGGGSYSFYDSADHANEGAAAGRIDLTANISAGVFSKSTPTRVFTPAVTDFTTNELISYYDPGFATATVVQVADSGGGLTVTANPGYFIRNRGDGSYSFYDSAEHATAGNDSATGRINLSADISAWIFSPTAHGRDTDGDGLDDRFEALIGWTVSTPLRTYHVFSAPNRADSNFDAPKPGDDTDKDGIEDRREYNGTDGFAAPAGWTDNNANGLRDRFEVDQKPTQNGVIDYVLDPIRRDTDGDGIKDATEIIGFKINPITFPVDQPYWVATNPNNPDTDRDTFPDGFERLVGLNPTNGNDKDEDGDGLPDEVEEKGWTVTTYGVSTSPYKQEGTWWPVDTTLPGYDLVYLQPDPGFVTGTVVQVSGTGGGLTAGTDYYTGAYPDISISGLYYLYDSEANASDGTDKGRIDITGDIKELVVGHQSTRMSKTDSVDTDEDGLTDYEEFFLHTDPSSQDSDLDGIDDRVEHLGFALGHKIGTKDIGIITTDPLDADTDNDMRSDGDEAELKDIELKRWTVRTTTTVVPSEEVTSGSAYRVYSNPLVADADYDGVVDGQEFADLDGDGTIDLGRYRTDPNNANTDGDKRDDGVEFEGGTNPLIEDFMVTIFINRITITQDGDWAPKSASETADGAFGFDFGVRLPGPGVAGLKDYISIVHDTVTLTDPFQYALALDDHSVEQYLPAGEPGSNSPDASLKNDPNDIDRGIAFEDAGHTNNGGAGTILTFARYMKAGLRSKNFGLTADQSFSFEGIVAELDLKSGKPVYSGNPDDYDVHYVYLGGLEGLRARLSILE